MPDFISLLFQYVDPYAVILAIALTQAVKYFLPAPPGAPKSKVLPYLNRFMPFVPVIVGLLVVLIKDHFVCNGHTMLAWDDAIIKGMISGVAGAYLYRTAKVSIFSE